MIPYILISSLLIFSTSPAPTPQLYCSSADFDLRKINESWQVFFPSCYGGSGKYWYQWFDLPEGWDFLVSVQHQGFQNYIFFPSLLTPNRYQIGLKLTDLVYKVELTTYFVVEVMEKSTPKIYIYNSPDPYWQIKEYKTDGQDLIVFPTEAQVETMVRNGDLGGLRKIIQRSAESNNSCQQKNRFFSQILGKIEQYSRNHKQIINDSIQAIQIYGVQLLDVNIRLQNFKKSINYNQSNSYPDFSLAPQTKIGLQKRIYQSEVSRRELILRMSQAQETMRNVQDNIIPNLQQKIKSLSTRAKDFWVNISQFPQIYSYYYDFLKTVLRDIAVSQALLNENNILLARGLDLKKFIGQKMDKLRVIDQAIAYDSQKLTQIVNYISSGQPTSIRNITNSYVTKIEQLLVAEENVKVEILKKTQFISAFDGLKSSYDKSLLQFSLIIGKEVKSCSYSSALGDQNTLKYSSNFFNSYFSSRISSSQLKIYIESIFRIDLVSFFKNIRMEDIPSSLILGNGQYTLHDIDLYSPLWYARNKLNYFYDVNNYFLNVFACSGLTNRTVRYGRIFDFDTQRIWVESETGEENLLIFGPCSKLESATGFEYPRIGDWMVWMGDAEKQNSYKVSNALCL